MNIYNAQQIRQWDAFTIKHEPVSSLDLMERAAQKCVQWLLRQAWKGRVFRIFCGKGNNGGDGLAIARLLWEQGAKVEVFVLEFGRLGSEDFQQNLQRLRQLPVPVHYIQSPEQFPAINKTDLVLDALFGSGLNKPLQDISAQLVHHLNASGATIVSIDVPSGLYLDESSKGNTVVKAGFTLTFQTPKLAFLVAENEAFVGEVQVLDIGLHPGFPEEAAYLLLDKPFVRQFIQPRPRFAHKGNFGHALLAGGSYGKIGAVVLAAKACLRAGVGLLSVYIPRCGYSIVQTAVPEAMTITDGDEQKITALPHNPERYNAVGLGPGMGTDAATQKALKQLIGSCKQPLVIDADGLNCLAQQPELLPQLPAGTILTPHPKEFERLFGTSQNDFERIALAQQKARELNLVLVLKGHHSFIASAQGPGIFNSTGNAGMATGGSGDVLTGIITSFVAQGYAPLQAALLGVYLHGLAGDLAVMDRSMEALIAGDLAEYLGAAFRQLFRN